MRKTEAKVVPLRARATCGTCIFWDRASFNPAEILIHPSEKHKEYACKLFPYIVWKLADDWCGQHKAIPY